MEGFFKLKERGTNVQTEIIAGLATFMTMAYIIFVNPGILEAAGVPKAGAIVATALAAGITTLFMGLYTNYPFALASGMGLNAFLAFGVVKGLGLSWQTAMGIVVIEGAIVTILVLTNIREAVMDAIPLTLKRAIGVGIGLFIALIGLVEAKFIVASPATLVTFGTFKDPGVIVATLGLVITVFLMAKRIKGSILLGIIISTILAIIFNIKMPFGVPIREVVPKSLSQMVSLPNADSFATMFQFDLASAFSLSLVAVIFAFLITDFFDTMGTVVAIGGEAGFLDKAGKLPRLKNVLLADSLAAVVGGAFGVSSVTTYIESAAGVSEGGRTGLTSVVVAILFFLSIFFAPIIGVVPPQATAPALIVVGFLMMSVVKDIPFNKFDEAFPAFLTLLTIPVTYSIARGIGYGFITYTLIKLLTGKANEVHWLMYIVSILFAISFIV